MTPIHHPVHAADRIAMTAMRAAVAHAEKPPLGPAARPGFDAMIAATAPAAGVTYEAATIGSVAGWWCRPASGGGAGAILYLHGGAYVIGSAGAYRNFAGQIAARAGLPVFVVDYRLAPEHPFPAAGDDAIAAYRWLAAMNGGPIVLAGDSAGGGLALALLQAATRDAALPRPAGTLVLSPWTDLALTGASMDGRAAADPLLTRGALAEAAALYLGSRSRCAPGASPLYGDLSDLPPVLIHVGEDEILLDDSLRYAERVGAAGGSATVHVWEGMTHVFPTSVGQFAAAEQALDIAGAFLRSVSASNR